LREERFNMNQDIINQVKHAVKEELAVNGSDELVIEELYNNENLAGLSFTTIDKIVHDLADAGEFELV